MPSGKAKFTGRKQVTKRDTEENPKELLMFNEHGPTWVSVENIDTRVQLLLQKLIPALFDDHGAEHEDFVGIVAEIQGAVWATARTIADCKLMNCAADTLKELEEIGRGGWIRRLGDEPLNTLNQGRISDETWWEVVELKFPTLSDSSPIVFKIDEFTRLAADATKKAKPKKVKDSDARSQAATLLATRTVNALRGNEFALGFSLASCSARQKEPSPAVKLLRDLGHIAGIYLADGTWRNKLAEAKKTTQPPLGSLP